MNDAGELEIKCDDFLRDNPHLYVHKAKRKKIALIRIEAANRHSSEIRIDLRATTLFAGEQSHSVERPDSLIRNLSEFTWDFVLYTILDFHPVLAAVDLFVFLTGPLYNRRLRKQLHLLSDGEMLLRPGECKQAILGFRGVTKAATKLQFSYRHSGEERQWKQCEIR
jgi:hypothetical protein